MNGPEALAWCCLFAMIIILPMILVDITHILLYVFLFCIFGVLGTFLYSARDKRK